MARKLGIGVLLAVTRRLYFRSSVPTFRIITGAQLWAETQRGLASYGLHDL